VDLLIWGGRRRQTRSWVEGRCGQDSARGKNNCWSARARARGPAGIAVGVRIECPVQYSEPSALSEWPVDRAFRAMIGGDAL
jgi:hypothetical protein